MSAKPMIFIATEKRADGNYGVEFEAEGWPEAEAHCVEKGWRLDGVLEMMIDAATHETIYDRQESDRAVSDLLRRAGKP